MQKQVVNIVSLGHSGSTLLGNILGSHPNGLHLGEITSPLKKGMPVKCRGCLDTPCPIWGTVLKEDFVKTVYHNFLASQQGNLEALRKIPILTRFFSKKNIYSKVFDNFAQVRFIVDSSKNIDWYKYNSRYGDHTAKHIFLKRDIRPIFASYKRSYGKTIAETATSVDRGIRSINAYYYTTEEEYKFVVIYEELVKSPENVLRQLCEFLKIDFHNEMLDFNRKDHHLIGGNHSLYIQSKPFNVDKLDSLIRYKTPANTVQYYRNISGITLDERWKTELSLEELREIEMNVKTQFEF